MLQSFCSYQGYQYIRQLQFDLTLMKHFATSTTKLFQQVGGFKHHFFPIWGEDPNWFSHFSGLNHQDQPYRGKINRTEDRPCGSDGDHQWLGADVQRPSVGFGGWCEAQKREGAWPRHILNISRRSRSILDFRSYLIEVQRTYWI